jgi:hypothetical protein
MQMHALAGESPKLIDFDVPASGLYLLAAPSAPEPVRSPMSRINQD